MNYVLKDAYRHQTAVSEPLKLATDGYESLMWVLGTKHRSAARAANVCHL